MKKFLLRVSAISCALCLCLGAASCNSESKKENPTAAAAAKAVKSGTELPNYRYVDLDSVLSKYNLAKDYNEEMLRMQTNMESEVKRHENSIQSFASSMQKKMQNNGYLSEESYRADEDKIKNMQTNAQRSVATLQNNFENAAMTAQKTVNDSIQAFIQEYNAKKGYDAIFFKGATLLINPALDITDEVVEGLNARYNKVKK
ncbi:MAG: OmpH family outer membrane protein [Muribaculaceae bacterium]|nr:OmpH family outer membrane protein [Muribaculaceae bacterium]MDE5714244.1 OmpH family outer membrane protein [Muribaculaceae bacterium]